MNAAINPYATIIKILGLAGFEVFLNPLYGDLFGFIRLVWLGITFLLFIVSMKIFALLLAFLFLSQILFHFCIPVALSFKLYLRYDAYPFNRIGHLHYCTFLHSLQGLSADESMWQRG